MIYLFVYGTLRPEFNNAPARTLAQQAVSQQQAYMFGRLYEVNGYPGATLASNEEKVFGCLFGLEETDALFDVLDRYEECSADFPQPHEYIRQPISVITQTGQTVEAWTYVYNRDTSSLIHINSGDYLDFKGK